jgi:RNA-directed DNA polymerase
MIFVKSPRSAQRVFESVQRYVTQTLKLVVNQTKSQVTIAEGCEFLGFAFVSGRRATIKVAPKKLKAFKRRVKELTGRSRGISMKRRLTDLTRYLRGWIGYFGLARQLAEFSNLDGCPFTLVTRAAVFGCVTGNSGGIHVQKFVT